MIRGPKFTSSQWKLLASAFSNIGQAVILFSFAALFVPEAVQLAGNFSQKLALEFFIGGLLIITAAVIIVRKGK